MSQPEHMNVIQAWFDGLNRSEEQSLAGLFCDNPIIRNAANPPLTGQDAPHRLLEDFFNRTESRTFRVLGAAEGDGMSFAWWEGTLNFRSGISIANVTITRPFSVTLQGVERFVFDPSGKILELDIVHETTTVVRMAMQQAQPTQ